jgi:NTP pyrophosphatase (non-canonical NTP hydrolase)
LNNLDDLKIALRKFSQERDWEKFHTPKNLASALSVEAAELLEIFQWMDDTQSKSLDERQLREVADEIADVLIYLVRISDVLGIDIEKSVGNKLVKNHEKYPIEKCKGSSNKQTNQ